MSDDEILETARLHAIQTAASVAQAATREEHIRSTVAAGSAERLYHELLRRLRGSSAA